MAGELGIQDDVVVVGGAESVECGCGGVDISLLNALQLQISGLLGLRCGPARTLL